MRIGKYAFKSKEQAKDKIKGLGVAEDENGNEYPTHKHIIVEIGFLIKKQGVYDDEMNEITPPVFGKTYDIDVLWQDIDKHPLGWKKYAVKIKGNGTHGFAGLDYQKLKLK